MATFALLDQRWVSAKHLAEWDQEGMESALEIVRCAIDPDHQRGGRRLINLSVVLPDKVVEDFVWTWQSECLVPESTLALLYSKRFTGFEVKPVSARFLRLAQKPPKLWELVPIGWAGMAKAESGIRLDQRESCPACGYLRYTGLQNPKELIYEKIWDGNDFFIVWPMPKYIFISERVGHTILDNHLTGVRILSIGDLEKTERFAPGRLHYYMPEGRARQLGVPLGIY